MTNNVRIQAVIYEPVREVWFSFSLIRAINRVAANQTAKRW